MTSNRPPGRISRRSSTPPSASRATSSKPPQKRSSKAPPRRTTIEVPVAWLETEPDESANKPTSIRPPLRPTMEVQMAWLDSEEPTTRPEPSGPPSSRKKPPRLRGASRTLPPMPVIPTMTERPPPPPRTTMEVELSWLELADDEKPALASSEERKKSSEGPPSKHPSAGPSAPARPIKTLVERRRKRGKPIPRED